MERPEADPAPPHPLIALQRTAGNRVATALIQRFRNPKTGVVTTVHQLGAKSLDELLEMLKGVRADKLESQPEEHWDLHMALAVAARARLAVFPDKVKPENRFGRAADVLERLNLKLVEDDSKGLSAPDVEELSKAAGAAASLQGPKAPPPTQPSLLDVIGGGGVGRVDAPTVRVVEPLVADAGWANAEATIRSYTNADTMDRNGNPIARTDWILDDRYVSSWDRPKTTSHPDGKGSGWGFSSAHRITDGRWVVHVHRDQNGVFLVANVQDADTSGMGAGKGTLNPNQLRRIGIPETVAPNPYVRSRWQSFGKPPG